MTSNDREIEQVFVTLDDGTPLMLRPVSAGDADDFRDGFERLSKTSRYFRFFSHIKKMPDWMVRNLTQVDHHDHEAWVAIDVSTDRPIGVGVARYIRAHDDPHTAEVAITVVDSHQQRGVATHLLQELAKSARENGIGKFSADVIGDNDAVQRMARHFGGKATFGVSGIVALQFDLLEDE